LLPAAAVSENRCRHPVPLVPTDGSINARHSVKRPRNQSMRFSPGLAVIMALALSGCVAVPLAQMAVSQMAASQMAAPKPACPGCATDNATGLFATVSQGMTDSFHKLTGSTQNGQTAAGDLAAK
jgi:hypothetical protein